MPRAVWATSASGRRARVETCAVLTRHRPHLPVGQRRKNLVDFPGLQSGRDNLSAVPRRIGRSFDGRQHRLGDDARLGPQHHLADAPRRRCLSAGCGAVLPAITTTDGRQMRICRTR